MQSPRVADPLSLPHPLLPLRRRRARWAFRARLLGLATVLVASASLSTQAGAKMRVVASIETLASLAREVGGSRVDVESLSRGYQDPHFIPAKPSLVLTLNRADALLFVGLDLEIGWLPPLVQQARNAKIQTGQPGSIDCASAITARDIPTTPADQLRALGDVHPLGNPHYWIPPDNALAITRLLARRFAALDPAGASEFDARARDFAVRLQQKRAEWSKRSAGLKGQKVVTYHRSWSYVTAWLGLVELGYLEPKPGIPPSANHTAQLIQAMKQQGVKAILLESFYPSALANIISRETGARVVALPSDVGATAAIKTYLDLIDALIAALTAPK